MLWTNDDRPIAANLARDTLATREMAEERWEAMRSYGRIEDRITWLPLDAVRIGLRENNPEQEKWNGRVLTSMARSDMLRLVGFRRDDDGRMWIGVNLLRHDLSAGGAWEAVERMRAANRDASAVSLRGVLDFAESGAICENLERSYTIHDPERLTDMLIATRMCGGCAGCSPPGLPVVLPFLIPPPATSGAPDGARPPIRDLAKGEPGLAMAVQHADDGWPRDYGRLIEGAPACGIRQIFATTKVLAQRQVVRGLRNAVARYGVDAAFVTDLGEDPFEAIRHAHRLPSLLLYDPTNLATTSSPCSPHCPRRPVSLWRRWFRLRRPRGSVLHDGGRTAPRRADRGAARRGV